MSADPVAPLLEVQDLVVEFSRGWRRPPLRAVDGVSFTVGARETVGLVGESGSGKTTIGRAILGLTDTKSGTVRFDGEDITHASQRRRRELSADVQVVFQDPYSSFNPTRTIGQTLLETLRIHKLRSKDALARVAEMLNLVGIPPEAASRYPANFSGGQRQRIAIARALMARPRFVVCDEPTSALDLSVQAQVLNLLSQLQDDFELGYLFISHDLAVVRHLSHRIVVLYHGRVMEEGDAATIYANPTHPYTLALLAAAPVPDPDEQRRRRAMRIRDSVTNPPLDSADACPFAPRCLYAIDECRQSRPLLEATPSGTRVACHRWSELQSDTARAVLAPRSALRASN
jgi:oligopeptide/dipeptide ABC transporter ATP-binding protein